jgi:hypothetical protein
MILDLASPEGGKSKITTVSDMVAGVVVGSRQRPCHRCDAAPTESVNTRNSALRTL